MHEKQRSLAGHLSSVFVKVLKLVLVLPKDSSELLTKLMDAADFNSNQQGQAMIAIPSVSHWNVFTPMIVPDAWQDSWQVFWQYYFRFSIDVCHFLHPISFSTSPTQGMCQETDRQATAQSGYEASFNALSQGNEFLPCFPRILFRWRCWPVAINQHLHGSICPFSFDLLWSAGCYPGCFEDLLKMSEMISNFQIFMCVFINCFSFKWAGGTERFKVLMAEAPWHCKSKSLCGFP